MENTTQLFLAVRFNCNKCHDHPFEKWTQDQYYGLAAYFAQVGRAEDPKYKGQKIGGSAVEGAKPLVEVITDQKGGEIKHERTGADAKPFFPYPVADVKAEGAARREAVAKWMTAPQNPYFAKSYVNRVWSYLTGVGIIEPVDDIRAGNPPTNPELLDALTADFIESGFDTQKLVKTDLQEPHVPALAGDEPLEQGRRDQLLARDGAAAAGGGAVRRHPPGDRVAVAAARAAGRRPRGAAHRQQRRAARRVPRPVQQAGAGELVRVRARHRAEPRADLAMVSGPVVAEAIKDPNSRLNKFVLAEQDDSKVIDEIFLSVLNRKPTAKEREASLDAIRGAGDYHAKMLAEYRPKAAAFEAYKQTLDAKQKVWEQGQRAQKPSVWLPLEVRRATGQAATKFQFGKDGSVLATGSGPETDLYTVYGLTEADGPLTALRLEVLADPSLPARGPGRADNGNFVLNELKLTYAPLDKPDAPPVALKLTAAGQCSRRTGSRPRTRWTATRRPGGRRPRGSAGQRGAVPVRQAGERPGRGAVHRGAEQRFGTKHTVGKFRLSVTTDPNPRLQSPLSAAQVALLETPAEKRTAAQKEQLRAMYLAQDKEYARLAAEAASPPPSDPRVLGAQDVVWALVNNPAFLFNH
jgi:hypothetical protein